MTGNFFEFVGIPAALGRTFSEAEAAPERQPRVAVLSDPFWRRRFNADPAVIGRELTINGEPFAVIGVLPGRYRSVKMVEDPDLYVPISALVLPTVNDRNNGNALNVLARLHPGTTREQAQQALTALGRQLEQAYPADNANMGGPSRVFSLRGGELADSPAQFVGPAVLLALFGLVLLSACANVAGLLLARAAGRQREVAIRVALGASRLEIIRLLLTESFGLATAGTIAGAVLSIWLMRALSVFSIPGAGSITLGLEPSIAMAVYAVGLLAAHRPALRARAGPPGDRGATSRPSYKAARVLASRDDCVCATRSSSARSRRALLLLVLSSLMLRSFMRVTTMDPGFDIERGLVASVYVDAGRYAVDGGLPLGEQLVERLTQLPGVESASFANILALGNDRSATRFEVLGGQWLRTAHATSTAWRRSTSARLACPSCVGAISTPAIGRVDRSSPSSAKRSSARTSPARPHSASGSVASRPNRISRSLASSATTCTADMAIRRRRCSFRPTRNSRGCRRRSVLLVLHVRAASPAAVLTDVRRAITSLDSTLAFDVQTLRQATGTEPALRRFGTQLLAGAGALGLLLAAIGLYGTMAFVVATRTSEIGLRMAIGATTTQILTGVLTSGA